MHKITYIDFFIFSSFFIQIVMIPDAATNVKSFQTESRNVAAEETKGVSKFAAELCFVLREVINLIGQSSENLVNESIKLVPKICRITREIISGLLADDNRTNTEDADDVKKYESRETLALLLKLLKVIFEQEDLKKPSYSELMRGKATANYAICTAIYKPCMR